MRKIVFDLDGTLADNKHRTHLAEAKMWREYFAACDKDIPIEPVIKLLLRLWYAGEDVEIWSARSDEVLEQTVVWLRNTIGHSATERIPLKMRKAGDYRGDEVVKKEWLDELRAKGGDIEMVFDDRNKIVAMWRANGVPCFQVAEGNF